MPLIWYGGLRNFQNWVLSKGKKRKFPNKIGRGFPFPKELKKEKCFFVKIQKFFPGEGKKRASPAEVKKKIFFLKRGFLKIFLRGGKNYSWGKTFFVVFLKEKGGKKTQGSVFFFFFKKKKAGENFFSSQKFFGKKNIFFGAR